MKERAGIEPELSFWDTLKNEATTVLAVGTVAAVVAGVTAVQGRWEKIQKKWLDDQDALQERLDKAVAEGRMSPAEKRDALHRFSGEAQTALNEAMRDDPAEDEQ